MKQPHVWVVEMLEDGEWKICGVRLADNKTHARQLLATERLWYPENKFRVAKYVREKP